MPCLISKIKMCYTTLSRELKSFCCLSGMTVHKSISFASAAFVVRLQNSFVHKALDFAEGGVVAGVEECGCFFGGEGLGDSSG